MDKRDIPAPRGAILDARRAERAFELRRVAPSDALAPFVRHYWFLSWDLEAPHTQSVLSRPSANLVSEPDGWSVSGVWTSRFDRTLEASGSVFGANFWPAGFAPFHDAPMHELTDQRRDMAGRLGIDGRALHGALVHDESDAARVARIEGLLLRLEPRVYGEMRSVNALVATAEAEPSMVSATQLAARAGCTLRTLQRRLRRFVGIGPKALLRRFRLQEAAAQLAEGTTNQAALAQTLGYFDQAHFVRDFTAIVGTSPARYQRSLTP